MKTQLLHGASVFTVGVVSLVLSATSVSAGGAESGPPKGSDKHGGDVTALVKQWAGNRNSTTQSSGATVDNHQKNWNSPVSIFTLGSGSGGSVYSACGCDEHPPAAGVTQSNDADNDARSGTLNWTEQSIQQSGTADATTVGGGGGHTPKPSDDGGYGKPHPKPDDCGCSHGPKPDPKPYPKPDDCRCDNGHKPGDTEATVEQGAHNADTTGQTSTATVDNQQKNWNSPISIGSVGAGSGHGCGCDEHPSGPPSVASGGYGDGNRCGCDGHGAGGVDQSNQADNTAKSGTVNGTDQSIVEDGEATATSESGGGFHGSKPSGGDYPGCGCDGGGQPAGGGDTVATVGQHGSNDNSTSQDSSASVDNRQTNINLPITLFSVGSGNGDVSQGNQADNTAKSETVNFTDQAVDQSGNAEATNESDGYGHGGGGDTEAAVGQDGSNENSTDQHSEATVDNQQTNVNVPITLFSVGSGNGDVSQGNQADNTAKSGTVNGTDQSVDQGGDATATSQSGGKGGGGDTDASVDQQAGNSNETVQDSSAEVTNDQLNVNAPITLFSVGSGNGNVDQSNSASNSASSGTFNGTGQGISQAGSAVAGLIGG